MLNKIINFSIKNKLIVFLFVAGLIAWGILELTRLPIDAVPDITDNQVQIITVSPSLGAPDVERLITFPIEQACSSIPDLKQMRSFSRFGLSLVTVVFNDGIDIYRARQQVNEQLQKVRQDLPNGIGNPEMAPVTTGLGEIYQYVLRPEKGYENKYDAMALRTLQDWIVRRQLLGTPGVAEVSSFGGKLKQYEIAVDQNQLNAHHITITDVFDALDKNNQNTGGAYIEKGPTVLYIRSEGLTASLEDIRKIVVKSLPDGTPLLVSDIATVQYGSAIRFGAMTYNDQGEVAGAVVMMLKGENSSAVIKKVKARIVDIQKMLPPGVVIEPFLDRTKMVNNAISTVETNLLEGALIVIFVLVFFLGNLRAGLIVSSVIPLSMLFAIILMNMFGVGGNLMSLGAIDFGLIVDGSVIVVEAILHRFSHSKQFRGITSIGQTEMDEEVGKSTGSMITSAVFSQIIILIVYLPILSLQGIEGKMFSPMAYTIAFAILGAFLLSVTYVPMMSALVLSKKLNHKVTITDKLMKWLERRYQPLLNKITSFPRTAILIAISLFGISVVLLMGLGGEFIPQLEEGDFAVETRLLTGSNLSNTIKSTQQASGILLKKFPEVTKVVTKIGSSEIPTDPMPFEAADMILVLKDKKEWTSAKTFAELSQKMTKELEAVPGITVGFQFPVQMRFNELMTGARQDVVCKIFGENLDTLSKYAHDLSGIIRTIDGAVNIYEEKVTGMPQIVIKYDRDAMAKYGLNVSDVNRVVNSGFAGEVAGQVYEGEKRFDMVVRLAGESRNNVADIRNLMISTPSGIQIPLSQVAGITETEGVNQVQREQTRRRIIIGFNIRGRDVQTIVNELQQKVNKQLKLSREYTITYGGTFENMTAAKARLSIVVPVALLLIFLLLYFAFGSVKQGLLIYSAIPLSATGGIFALWLRDMPFSISAGVGFIALFGVAVLNGILLVSEFNRLRKEGWTDVKRVVIHATKSKLRAVLMTALVPSLGFIPMAISTGAGGEVQKPLATVVIGGLIISTMLTLFLLPVLYILSEGGYRKTIKMNKAISAVALLCLIAATASAQGNRLSLTAALDSAARNNYTIQAATTEAAYYRSLQKSGWDIDKTTVVAEYGSYNSLAKDNRFAIGQTIQFPGVYVQQRHILRTNALISETDLTRKKIEVRTQIKLIFYRLLALQQKKALLAETDSIYSNVLTREQQRYKAGDVDLIELSATENQRLQIATQLQSLQTDYEVLQNQLGVLMNSRGAKEPFADSMIYRPATIPDGLSEPANPNIALYRQRLSLTEYESKLEGAKMLPSLSAGYNNTSIRGWQRSSMDPEQYFDYSKRFSSVNVGVGIPIFYTAQKARINAASKAIEQRKQELAAITQEISGNLQNAVLTYLQRRNTVYIYRNAMLPNAATIITSANDKLALGEISYLNWVMLINQAVQVRNDYFNTIEQMNEAAIEIERLSAIN
jgi:heavy metal efflux system protein